MLMLMMMKMIFIFFLYIFYRTITILPNGSSVSGQSPGICRIYIYIYIYIHIYIYICVCIHTLYMQERLLDSVRQGRMGYRQHLLGQRQQGDLAGAMFHNKQRNLRIVLQAWHTALSDAQ